MNIQLTPTLLAKPLIAAFVLAGLVGMMAGYNAGCAALAGGLTAWLSQVYFAKHLRPAIQSNDKAFMRTFYRAEMRKLVLAAFLFVPAIVWARAPGIPLFGSYAAIQIGWMLWLLQNHRTSLFEIR
jgi:F0F1-type ATP synthase assembly protein I